MPKYIDWYMVELERRLHGRMPQQQLGEILSETEAHLLEATSDDKEEYGRYAEKLAISRFGSPNRIAQSVLNANDPPPPHPWRAGILPGIAIFGLVAAFLTAWILTFREPRIESVVFGSLAAVFGLLLLFGVSVARQFLRAPIAVAGAVAFVGCWLASSVLLMKVDDPAGMAFVPRSTADAYLKGQKLNLVTARNKQKLFDAAGAMFGQDFKYTYTPQSQIPEGAFVQEGAAAKGKFLVPAEHYTYPPGGGTGEYKFGFLAFDSFKDAQRYWLTRSQFDVHQNRFVIDRAEKLLVSIPQALKRSGLQQLWATLPFAASVAGAALGIAWAANLLVFALYSLSRSYHFRRRRYA